MSIKLLGKQSLVYGFGHVITRLVTFLLLPLYTNKFTPEQYGIVALFYTFVPLLNIVVRYGMGAAFLDGEQNSDWIQLKPENWFEIAKWLKDNPDFYFDSLQCNTGFDLGEGLLESRYNLHSMKHLHSIEIRIKVSVEKPDIPSVESIWRVADWFERETYDMFGINFTGHSDLRRILLPEDWEGWPLRKDYEEQETYHGIVVPKVKEGWE